MPKDARYNTAQKLILGGYIKTLSELLDAVDKTPLALDMKTAPSRLNKLINQPQLFTFQDCYKIAAILEVDEKKVIDIVFEEWISKQKPKRAK